MIDRRSFIGLGTLTATSLLTGGKITDVLASEAKGASGPTIETNAGKTVQRVGEGAPKKWRIT